MFESIVFIFFSAFTVLTLVLWLVKKKEYKDRHSYDTRELVALYTLPRLVIVWFVILLTFFFLSINKLHLLYIFPAMYFIVAYIQARRVLRKDEEDGRFKVN